MTSRCDRGARPHGAHSQKTDRAAINKSLLDRLVTGGRFIVIDHDAEADSGARDVLTLQRIDAAEVKRDVLAAGFELGGESDVLRHPEEIGRRESSHPKSEE